MLGPSLGGNWLLKCPKCKKIGHIRKIAEPNSPQRAEGLSEDVLDFIPETKEKFYVYQCKHCGHKMKL